MIAYFILVHRYPEQFRRMFNAIWHADNHYLIHVDKRSGIALQREIAVFLSGYPNASLLKSENMQWGGYSLVDAELRGMAELLKVNAQWDFFINMSGQDFPLKSQESVFDFLKQHRGKDFLKLMNQRDCRPETLNRIEHYFLEQDDRMSEPMMPRRFLSGVTPYIGNQWMMVSRQFCEFVTKSPEVERFRLFYQNTLIPDEGFFQTVMMNTSYRPNVVNDDKREIDWIPAGTIKLRPRDYTVRDVGMLKKSPHLFARKFDETIDRNILSLLEEHLSAVETHVA